MKERRNLEPFLIPPGAGVETLLSPLRSALSGAGPALLPLPGDNPAEAERMVRSLLRNRFVDNNIAVVVGTSGSTGNTKGVLLSADALVASANATHARLGGAGQWLLAMPARYIGGLQVLIRSLVAETSPTVLDLTSGFHVDLFVKETHSMRSNDLPRYTALVPTQLARLLSEKTAITALRTYDAVLIGGSPTPQSLFERAKNADVPIIRAYGMSETASGCVYEGLPLEGVRIRLSDDDNANGGRIVLSGPMLASGYHNHPQDTAAVFRNGWFHTADWGTLSTDGRLEVLGRIDDVINTGGLKVAPYPIERILTSLPGIAQACVIGTPDPEWGQRVIAVIVPKDPRKLPRPEAMRQALRDQFDHRATPREYFFLPALPLTRAGKVDRKAVAAMVQTTDASSISPRVDGAR